MASEGLPGFAHTTAREWLRQRIRTRPVPAWQQTRKRPPNLVYDVDDVPPALVQFGLAIQHIFLMSSGWIYISVIAAASGGTQSQTESVIQMSMLAGGIATILQSMRRSWGSGYLCPLSASLTYLQPSVAAISSGGFSLLFGMVAVAGAASALISRIVTRLRFLFPPEVTGLMISMSGLQLIAVGCPRIVGYAGPGSVPEIRTVVVGITTLLVMVLATTWNRGKLHVLPMLLGIFAGFAAAIATGVLPWSSFMSKFQEPWLSLPHRATYGLSFQVSLLLPFLLASVTASLKSIGDLTLCQKVNDEEWKRTDMKSVSGGLLANGIGTLASGLFGGVAQNTVSSSVGLSLASGASSRAIAVPTGLLVIALAFLPRIAAIFAVMPLPVTGAILVYSACFIIVGGFQLLTSRMLDVRRIFVVGISLIFGLSVEISPDIYRQAPELLRPIFSSSVSLATVLVVLLSVLMRIGISRRRTFSFRPGVQSYEVIHDVMAEQGAAWGMRREVEMRAEHAIHEAIGSIVNLDPMVRVIEVSVEFDESFLEAALEYDGAAPKLVTTAPSAEELATDEGVAALSGFLIRQYADEVRVRSRGGVGTRIQLRFEH